MVGVRVFGYEVGLLGVQEQLALVTSSKLQFGLYNGVFGCSFASCKHPSHMSPTGFRYCTTLIECIQKF